MSFGVNVSVVRHTWVRGLLGIAGLLLGGSIAGAAEPNFQGLGDLPGGDVYSQAMAVSADGSTVVGWSDGPEPGLPAPTSGRAFRWTETGGMVELVDAGSPLIFTMARDVSAEGSVVVGECYDDSTGSFPVTCMWTESGGLTAIVDPGSGLTGNRAAGVSGDGTVVVGTASSAGGGVAYRWTAATGMESLVDPLSGIRDSSAFGISDDASVITGQVMQVVPDVEPMRWTQATGLVGLGDVPGGFFYALGMAISGDGSTIVGGARTSFGSSDEAFAWTQAGGFVLFDPAHGAQGGSTASAASYDGSIIVGYKANLGATIWTELDGEQGVQNIAVAHNGLNLTGWTLHSVSDCSADGLTLVGQATNPQGRFEAYRVVVSRVNVVPAIDVIGVSLLAGAVLLAGVLLIRHRLGRPSVAA